MNTINLKILIDAQKAIDKAIQQSFDKSPMSSATREDLARASGSLNYYIRRETETVKLEVTQ